MDAVVISERGNEKLPHGGFCYVHDKWSRDGSTHFWRCERRRPNCKGRVHTNHDATEIRVVTAHNHDGVPFLLADSGPEENRILIFGTDAFADIMDRSAVWFGDGTFSITLPLFSQVYTVLAETMGAVLPVLYCLLPNKTEATYNRMFDMIKKLRPRSLPTEFNCDFESAVIKAASRAFPNCQICGCFFHLVRNVKKHIAQEGLLPRYNTDGDFQLQCRMISALAFVPIDDLDYAVDDLSLILPPELQPVLSYFEDTYMGRPVGRQRVRRPPTFAPSIWSVHDRTLAGTHRTNNHAEAAHRRIQSEMGVDHPSIWKFVDGLRRVQNGRDNFYESLIRGDQTPVKLRRYRLADERYVLTVMRDYDTRTTEDFLRGIAYNYEMNP